MNSVSSGTQGLGHSSTPVGSNKALVTKIKSTTSLPSCLNSCTAGIQASDVKSGYCFIDRHCYKAGETSPYAGAGCRTCNPTIEAVDDVGSGVAPGTGPMEWSAPDTTSHCFIGDMCIAEGAHEQVCTGSGWGRRCSDDPCSKCIPSVSGTEYSPIAGGCLVSTTHAFAQRPRRLRTMSAALAVRSWVCPLSHRAATTRRARRPQARSRARSRWSSSDLPPACSCVAETESMATVCIPQPAICVRRPPTTATGMGGSRGGRSRGERSGRKIR